MALLNVSIFTGNRVAGWFAEVVPSVPNAYLIAGLFHLAVVVFVAVAIKVPPRSLR